MRIIESNNVIQFIIDDEAKETPEAVAFCKMISDYTLTRRGASLFITNKAGVLVSHFNPFDNTQLIHDADAFALAGAFGTKQFAIGNARVLDEKQVNITKAQTFRRDRVFPLVSSEEEKSTSAYKIATLEYLLKINKDSLSDFYTQLSELFDRCADFTPGKQTEYAEGNKDKVCRFHPENQGVYAGVVTEHIFLLNNQNKVLGTISATISVNKEGVSDVYFYDEVVDYFTLMNDKEKAAHQVACEISEEKARKKAVCAITEPYRIALLKPLIVAAQNRVRDVLQTIGVKSLENTRAFIRVAADREQTYLALGCAETNSNIYVVHADPTPVAKMLDAHVKQLAEQQLQRYRLSASAAVLSSGGTFAENKVEVSAAVDLKQQVVARVSKGQ